MCDSVLSDTVLTNFLYIRQDQEDLKDFEVPMVTLELLATQDRRDRPVLLDREEALVSPDCVVTSVMLESQVVPDSRDQLAILELRASLDRLDSPAMSDQLAPAVRLDLPEILVVLDLLESREILGLQVR